MIQPQVLNLNSDGDGYIAIDGYNVINDTTQAELGLTETTIDIKIYLFDLQNGSQISVDSTLNYDSPSDFWAITLDATLKAALTDRHKYVGKISEDTGTSTGMRDIKLQEFSVDNGSFEATWMRLPYEIVIGSPSYIQWYAVGDIGGTVLFKALAYEGGTGTTAATDASRVTHRDAIVVGP